MRFCRLKKKTVSETQSAGAFTNASYSIAGSLAPPSICVFSWNYFTAALDCTFSQNLNFPLIKPCSLFVFLGHPGWDRCPQWHLQERRREQVEDGQSAGQLRGGRVPPAQAGWHESTMERPEDQIRQHQVSKSSQLNLLTFAFSSLLGHGCQIAVFCPFAALKLRRKKDILA